uniref:Venom allergen/ancylostoma secreted protein-like 1 isoform 1 n=1 Tax=Heligmosomoides polygyrus bakeri TaxID=375939 RepID=G4XWW3_HELBE|nr:venom allergen/ancylostoma secreted protein-like 1 isoform 1 [Heligmosomoides bakeri]
MWLPLILLSAVANREGTATTCPGNSGVTDAARTAALDAINEARRTAVNGLMQNGATAGTNLPHGSNMYMLEWDCNLEALAGVMVPNDCSAPTAGLPNNGLSAAVVTPAPTTADAVMTQGVASWPVLLQTAANAFAPPAAGTPVKYEGPTAGAALPADVLPLGNMIRGSTTKVGCTVKICTAQAVLVCLYDQPDLKQGDTVYDAGTGVCQNSTADKLCTLYPPPTCDIYTGLCVKTDVTTTTTPSATTTASTLAVFPGGAGGTGGTGGSRGTGGTGGTGGANTRCPQNPQMTDDLRYLFRDMHNYRRSETALGRTIKNTGNYLPSSSNMQYMRYSCPLEVTAIHIASTCPGSLIQSGRLIGQVPIGAYTFTTATQDIVKSLWRVVRQVNGPGMQVTFKAQHVGTPIASFTQMAWAASRRLGCAVARCPTAYIAVCNYEPIGNIVGQQIYTPGTPCTACTYGSTCTATQGLCTLP